MNISIIVPVYNAQKYLPNCLDSILDQTQKDFEVICIDDGSEDESLQVIKAYQDKDSRINVIHQDNKGPAAARNLGIEVSSGEFICFLDADDYFPSNDVLEGLYSNAKRHMMSICGGSMEIYLQDRDDYQKKYKRQYKKYRFKNEGIKFYKDYQFDFGYTRFIYKRDFLVSNSITFPNYKRFQDPPFFVKAMIAAGKFYAIPKCTYIYRSSYKKVSWDDRKVDDVICAISEIMHMAAENDYSELFLTSAYRLVNLGYMWEYKDSYKINSNSLKRVELIKDISIREKDKMRNLGDRVFMAILIEGIKSMIKGARKSLFICRMMSLVVLDIKYFCY